MLSRSSYIVLFMRTCQIQKLSHTYSTETHPVNRCPYLGYLDPKQDDISRDFYLEIVNKSIKSAFDKYGSVTSGVEGSKRKHQDITKKKSVVIVGAGLSGLSAAFELGKVGYTTRILELQNRVGGRTKTLREGFADGLHAEGGAMRIPPYHYLTRGYLEKFGIPLRPFVNYNESTWFFLEGQPNGKIRTKDWEENNRYYSDMFFPGWDKNIPSELKPVEGILDLYQKTIQPVKNDLYELIYKYGRQTGWEEWVKKWSSLSVYEFFRSAYGQDDVKFRPWSEEAIRGIEIAAHRPEFEFSLVDHLRDSLGGWWKELQTPLHGMDALAESFIQQKNIYDYGTAKVIHKVIRNIKFGTKVKRIKKTSENEVHVTGYNNITGKHETFIADAAIITVPLPVLGRMDIDMSEDKRRAIAKIHCGASTKIVLQCKTRFWEKHIGTGGFTNTNLPIGQLHYPSPCDGKPNRRGLLVSYTRGEHAFDFGLQTKAGAIETAIREISKIHPEIIDEFEVGMVQAWSADESSQGAHACLLPFNFNNGMKTLMNPHHPIYLAGDAISYSNPWIQGALESGLNAAYHLYCKNNSRN